MIFSENIFQAMGYPNELLLLQEQVASFRWTYVWLALGGLLLVLAALAFAYLLVKRRHDGIGRLLRHPALGYVDQMLSKHIPGVWRVIRRRFTLHQWHGLALTGAGGVVFVSFYLFLMITEDWTDQDTLYAFDQRIYSWLLGSMNEQVAAFMQVITHLGDGLTATLISLVLGIFLLLHRRKWQVVALLLSVGVGSALNWGLKWIFERSRPGERLADSLGHSFPSGHSFTAMVLYGFIIYLTWLLVKSDGVRIGVTLLLTLLIFLIGLSRVILRVHWVSDVAGGLSIGLAWLVCSLIISRALQAFYSPSRIHPRLEKQTE